MATADELATAPVDALNALLANCQALALRRALTTTSCAGGAALDHEALQMRPQRWAIG